MEPAAWGKKSTVGQIQFDVIEPFWRLAEILLVAAELYSNRCLASAVKTSNFLTSLFIDRLL